MSLIEVCEPIFVYVCALRRAAARGAEIRAEAVRSEVKGVFAMMHSAAVTDAELESQYEQVELPLLFFVDYMILESPFGFARNWQPLAYERNELAGDQKFFDMLEETLGDTTDEADERLAVFHTCLGLGFTGMHEAGSDYLIRARRRVYARVRKAAGVKSAERICPEAYAHVDTSNFIQQTGRKLGAMALALLGLIGVLLAANFFLFRYTSEAMGVVLNEIVKKSGAPAAAAAPGRAPRPEGTEGR
jgi:type IV/VI secretion system ImpK/VasF family protein